MENNASLLKTLPERSNGLENHIGFCSFFARSGVFKKRKSQPLVPVNRANASSLTGNWLEKEEGTSRVAGILRVARETENCSLSPMPLIAAPCPPEPRLACSSMQVSARFTAMPKFHVKATFTVEGRPHFVLAGSIVEGEILPGMFVHVPFDSSAGMKARIDCIEFARRLGGHEDTCLCIRYSKREELEIWRGLDIVDQTFEVATDGSH